MRHWGRNTSPPEQGSLKQDTQSKVTRHKFFNRSIHTLSSKRKGVLSFVYSNCED